MITLAEATSGACGCDAGDADEGLIPVDEALAAVLAMARPVAGVESLPLAGVTGRALAEPVSAQADMPPFDASAMDGYAIRLAALKGPGPWQLPVRGRVAAGDAPPRQPALAALRILTGAPLPAGCDAVVMQEHVTREGDTITLTARPEPGQHIRRAGEDMAAGAELLPAGRLVGVREAAAIAAAGMAAVRVRRRLRVTILSTGSELAEPGQALAPGQIWNCNRYQLCAALTRPWITLSDLGIVSDRPDHLAHMLRTAAERSDLVVTTGGVSVGDEDHMPAVLRGIGGEVKAMRLAIKPGKPLLIGRLGSALVLGLPGNPVATFVGWTVFGARIAEALAGIAGTGPRRVLARAGFDLIRRPGRCEFRPARIGGYDASGAQVLEIGPPGFSHRTALLAAADGLALIPAGADRISKGDVLEFMPFAPAW